VRCNAHKENAFVYNLFVYGVRDLFVYGVRDIYVRCNAHKENAFVYEWTWMRHLYMYSYLNHTQHADTSSIEMHVVVKNIKNLVDVFGFC